MRPPFWESKTLEDVCSVITDGSHFSPKTASTGDFAYITVRDIRDSGIDFSNCQFVTEAAFRELQKTGCQPQVGDVLFSKDGTVGKVAIVTDPRPFVVLSSLAILRPNPDLVTPEFLSYVLQSPTVLEDALGMKTGTAIRRVVLRNLKKLVFPLPPLDEQRRIVEILDVHLARLDKALAELQGTAKLIDHLTESYRHGVVSGLYSEDGDQWQMTRLGAIAKWSSGGTPQSGNPRYYGGEIPWCVIGDLTESEVSETAKSLTQEGLSVSSAKVVQPGTVFLAMYGASIGRTGIASIPMATNQAIACAVPNEEVNPWYLLLFLQSQKRMFIHSGKGGAQPNISQTIIKDWEIAIPPLDEQNRLVEKVELHQQSTSMLMDQNKKMQAQVLLLRMSLLNAASTGALKV